MALITCENAVFAYDGTSVISGLNFVVESGDYLCIVGENGSGKSTLVKGLLGLVKPTVPDCIRFGDGLTAKGIGYLPQKSAAQAQFPASVWEVVRSGALASSGLFFGKEVNARVEKNLARLDISDKRRASFRTLSGGQQQRVLLARALCACSGHASAGRRSIPFRRTNRSLGNQTTASSSFGAQSAACLLLDEPVAGLDPVITQDLYALIAKLNREEGLTVVMVSHDIHAAVHHAQKILHLKSTQAFFGSTADYLQTESGRHFIACAGMHYT
jgi:zinc transport system ATP-binding protein